MQFSFRNFKSFKSDTKMSCVSVGGRNNEKYAISTPFRYSVLKSVGVYGANASGKTKLFEAFKFMRCVICPPRRENKIPVFDYWQTKYDPFRLSTQSTSDNSVFEVVFIIDGIQYRYGFELNAKGIELEWLFQKQRREIKALTRDKNLKTYINPKSINEKVADMIRSASMMSETVPFISILSTFNDPLCRKIVDWFKLVTVISANDIASVPALENAEKTEAIVKFLKAFDFNIENLSLHQLSVDEIPDKIKSIIKFDESKGRIYDGIQVKHNVYNELYERDSEINFKLEVDESFGTNRLFHLSWPIISTIRNNGVLMIDEIDSGIHPNIVQTIIALFNNSNNNGAQLIFNTQNTNLLSTKEVDGTLLLRKDQIFVANKNRYGESSITPIIEISNDLRSNIEKSYLSGDVTGIPYINSDAIDAILNY